MDNVKHTNDDYVKYFDALSYLDTYRTGVKSTKIDGDVLPWIMQKLHEVFVKGNIKAKSLLDVGTGPCVDTVISAAPHCDNIFLSDLTPQCRDVLHQWLNNTLPHSFQPFFKFVVGKEDSGESPMERESKLREKVLGILLIDIMKAQPLGPCWFPKFQLITSSLCLDSAADDVIMHETAARNVDSLLEVGGHVVLLSITKATVFQNGKYVFGTCYLTTEGIKGVWTRLGYDLVDVFEYKYRQEERDKLKREGFCLLVARKGRKTAK